MVERVAVSGIHSKRANVAVKYAVVLMDLSNVKRINFSVGVYAKLEKYFESAPLTCLKITAKVFPIIGNLIEAQKFFVTDCFFKERPEVYTITVIGKMYIVRKQSKPGLFITRLQSVNCFFNNWI